MVNWFGAKIKMPFHIDIGNIALCKVFFTISSSTHLNNYGLIDLNNNTNGISMYHF